MNECSVCVSLDMDMIHSIVDSLKGPEDQCGLSRWLSGKESACQAGDQGSSPGSGRSPGGGDGNPLQYSCLENPMDRETWWATVHGATESDLTVAENTALKGHFIELIASLTIY